MTAGKREKQHKRMGGFPGDPTVRNHFATQGTWVPSLVRELRSLTPGVTTTEPMLRNKRAPGAATREKPACQHSQKKKKKWMVAFSWLRCRQGLTDLEEDLVFFTITIFQMQTYSQAGRTVPKGLVYQLKSEKLFRVTPGLP